MKSKQRAYFHRGGSTPLLAETLGGALRRVAVEFPDEEAVVSLFQGQRLGYRELDERVDRLARALIALGFQRGDRIGIWSTDNVEWILVQFATARIGAILVNINPGYRVEELRHALESTRVQGLFFEPSFRGSDYGAMLAELMPEVLDDTSDFRARLLPELRHLVVFDPANAEQTEAAPGFLAWQDLLRHADFVPTEALVERERRLDCDQAINIQFTSGTTGLPKAVVLTHHNILNNARFVAEALGFTHRDRLCVPVPFYHCFGMVVSNLACMVSGATIVIPSPHFDAGATLAAIQDERCTALHGVPTMFIEELEHPDLKKRDLSSLRTGIVAGAPCPTELVCRVMKELHCPEILIGYGQTEASPVTHLTLRGDSPERRTQTVGKSLPYLETKIVEPEENLLLAAGESGEVCFRGYQVMRGYFEQEEATRGTIDAAGWLHSGDLGVMDEDGYLTITGRLKDLIIRGGENIYPAEIEAFYLQHPKVEQVAVFSVPDPRMGEEVGAWIKLRKGVQADPEELRQYARERLARFKVPRYLWLVDEFPLTISGKIQKFKLRERVAERLADERTARRRPGRERVS